MTPIMLENATGYWLLEDGSGEWLWEMNVAEVILQAD